MPCETTTIEDAGKEEMSEPVYTEVRPQFPSHVQRYGPYLVRIGDVEMEFEDEACDRVLRITLRRAGRDVEVNASHSGVAPIEVSVRMQADNFPHWYELHSKRADNIDQMKWDR